MAIQSTTKRLPEHTYQGNPFIKRAGVQIAYTHEEIQDFIKCSLDPVYFATSYVKIVKIDGGLTTWQPYSYQLDIFKTCIENRFVICKLPRQAGKTTTIASLIAWLILFTRDYRVAILANKEKQAKVILERIKRTYENIPWHLQIGVTSWGKNGIVLENGSAVVVGSTASDSIRGDSFNLVYLDEFAYVDRGLQEDFFRSTLPTISSGTTSKLLITSTPRGLEKFYSIYTDAVERKNDFVPMEIHWSQTPGRDETWKRDMVNKIGEEAFRVEYEIEFLGSSNTLINGPTLLRLRSKLPIRMSTFGEHEQISKMCTYEDPDPKHTYVMTVDVAQGIGGDYSAFSVIDITEYPHRVVCTYKSSSISPLLFPDYIFQVAKAYNNAWVLVETNDQGQQVINILNNDLEYEALLSSSTRGRRGVEIGGGFGGMQTRLGVRTTKSVKRIGCANLKTIIERDKLILNDRGILDELNVFVAKGNSYQADTGMHDDLVMTLVLYAWLTTQTYFKDLTNNDIRKSILEENQQQIEHDLVPFGFYDNGLSDDSLFSFDDVNTENWIAV